MAKSSLGGEVFALSRMADHRLLLKVWFGPFDGVNPGEVGSGDCESMATRLATAKMLSTRYLLRHFLSIQRALEGGGLGNSCWLRGAENPADGLTIVRSDVVPLLRLLESGRFPPGQLRPLEGVAWKA